MVGKKKWDKTFKKRLNRHYDEMKWLYMELYHNDQKAFDSTSRSAASTICT